MNEKPSSVVRRPPSLLEETMPYSPLPRRQVEALGINTSYYEAGNPKDPPLLLLHGMSTSADSFRETMHDLSDRFYLIAPDIPGFGFSDLTEPYTVPHLVEWLADFVSALELPPVHLLGHSFGGALAPAYALDYPEDVQNLVLLAPAILSASEFPDWLKKAGMGLGLFDLGTAVSRLFLQRQIRVPFYDPSRQPESIWQRRLADYERARSSPEVLKALAFYGQASRLADVQQPTCLIWGRNDPVVNPDHATRLAALLPDAQVHFLEECGHAPMLEQRDDCLAIVQEFLT
jgi:2-hydroxy-6-oxonona-2,4-dienedioate hydrolase